jgi:UDP-N-acetylglucosamine 2-epimerase (non-hydrolysing)
VNLPYSEYARRNLLAEGLRREHTFVTGSPMAEVLKVYSEKIDSSEVLIDLGLEKNKYILLSAHREENIDNETNFFELMNAINTMAEKYNLPIVYSTHPRSAKFIEKRKFKFNPLVKQMKPFGFSDYNALQKNAFCVVSDSGTLAEESANLHFPCVSIRTSTERQEAVDKGNMIIGSITSEQVLQAVDMAVEMNNRGDLGVAVPDYADQNTSTKVVKIIQSYTAIINKMIWRK